MSELRYGNGPNCHDCEALRDKIDIMEIKLAALRLQVKMMFTIDEIEAWHTHLRNIGEIAWVERNLRSPRFGLAEYHKRKR